MRSRSFTPDLGHFQATQATPRLTHRQPLPGTATMSMPPSAAMSWAPPQISPRRSPSLTPGFSGHGARNRAASPTLHRQPQPSHSQQPQRQQWWWQPQPGQEPHSEQQPPQQAQPQPPQPQPQQPPPKQQAPGSAPPGSASNKRPSVPPPLPAPGMQVLPSSSSFEQPATSGSYVPACHGHMAPGSYQPPPFAGAVPCMQAHLPGGGVSSYVPPPPAMSVPGAYGTHPASIGNSTASGAAAAQVTSCLPPPVAMAPGSFVPAPVSPPSMPINMAPPDDQQPCGPGVEMTIGAFRFRCSSVLGRGSFSEVWAGETLVGAGNAAPEVALKDVCCKTQSDLQQALFETGLLERLQFPEGSPRHDQAPPPPMRIPKYLAHRVDAQPGGTWRVRTAMTKVPGEPLDAFLRRGPPPGRDGPGAVRCGCVLAQQLIRQLGPALDRMSRFAFHRDVNSHNILISDAIDGGKLRMGNDVEDTNRRVSFWLIDFGLAVDSNSWQKVWSHSDVAGDCRYWPPCSFLMSFYGADETAGHRDFCHQYKTRLDIVGLGLTAIELLCATAVASSDAWGAEGLRGSWRRLFDAWEKYREEVTRWHLQIFKVFAAGGDIVPLYRELAQERVVDKVTSHIARIRNLLRACTQRAEEHKVQRLLGVLAEMIDEKSTMSLSEAVEAVGGECGARGCPVAAARPAIAPNVAGTPAVPLAMPMGASSSASAPATMGVSRPLSVGPPAPIALSVSGGRTSFTPQQPLAPLMPAPGKTDAHQQAKLQWSAPLPPAEPLAHLASQALSQHQSQPQLQHQPPLMPQHAVPPQQQQQQPQMQQQQHQQPPPPQPHSQHQQHQPQPLPPVVQHQHSSSHLPPHAGPGGPATARDAHQHSASLLPPHAGASGTAAARDASLQRAKCPAAAPAAGAAPNGPVPCHVRPRFAGA